MPVDATPCGYLRQMDTPQELYMGGVQPKNWWELEQTAEQVGEEEAEVMILSESTYGRWRPSKARIALFPGNSWPFLAIRSTVEKGTERLVK